VTLPPPLAGGDLDRAAERRSDPEWLARAWADPASRLLLVDPGGRLAVSEDAEDEPACLVLQSPDGPINGARLVGVDPHGVAYFARDGRPATRPGVRLAGLRDIGGQLGSRDAQLAVTAVALANWHASHPRCPRCGSETEPRAAGFARHCPADGSEHFPRTDPAVIVLVSDGSARCLLGQRAGWPAGRYSTLAGYVEAGESAEQAVSREIREEAGVVVRDVRYVASQPWPFPASLMLGFTARADPDAPVVTFDGELADARWFDREELARLTLPPPVSIARTMIDIWASGGR
jgi:NAD+ diphosphatase